MVRVCGKIPPYDIVENDDPDKKALRERTAKQACQWVEKEITRIFSGPLNKILGGGSWTRLLEFDWVGLSSQVPGNEDVLFVCETEEELEEKMKEYIKELKKHF